MQMLRWLDAKLEPMLLSILMGLMTILIFVQVVMRYVFENSLVWSEELVRWLFIWTIWIGVAHGFRTQQHVCISIMTDRLPARAAKFLDRGLRLALIAFFLWVGWLGIEQARSPIVMRQSSVVMSWPVSGEKVGLVWLYATLPVGAALSVWRLTQGLFSGAALAPAKVEV